MQDGLDGLGHDPVVCSHNQDNEVGDLCAAGPHGRKGGVARRVQEGHAISFGQFHLVGADVLGDPAVLTAGDIRLAQGVEEGGLAVVDMAHDRHNRGPGLQGLVPVIGPEEAFLHVGIRHTLDRVTELGGDQLGSIAVDHVVDLQHHALAHQELDNVHAAGGHPVRQLGDGDHVRDHHLAGGPGLLLGTALALFPLAFPSPAD